MAEVKYKAELAILIFSCQKDIMLKLPLRLNYIRRHIMREKATNIIWNQFLVLIPAIPNIIRFSSHGENF